LLDVGASSIGNIEEELSVEQVGIRRRGRKQCRRIDRGDSLVAGEVDTRSRWREQATPKQLVAGNAVVVNSVAASQGPLVTPARRPGKPKTRSEVVAILLDNGSGAAIFPSHQQESRLEIERGLQIVTVRHRRDVLIAQAIIQRKVSSQLEVVVEVDIPFVAASETDAGASTRCSKGSVQEEICC